MQLKMADFAPVPSPGELDETYMILAHSLHHVKSDIIHKNGST